MPRLDVGLVASLLASVFAASLLQGFTGFGFAIAAVPLISLFMPPAKALPYVLVLQALIGLIGLPGSLKVCRWRLLAWLGVGVMVGTPLGLGLITILSPAAGRLAIGGAVLFALVLILWGARLDSSPSGFTVLATGVASGVMNGLAGMSGPPAVALLVAAKVDPAQARGTLLIFVLGAALAALVPLAMTGGLSADMVAPQIVVLPALFAGWGLGASLFGRATPSQHRAVALITMGFLALVTIARALPDLS